MHKWPRKLKKKKKTQEVKKAKVVVTWKFTVVTSICSRICLGGGIAPTQVVLASLYFVNTSFFAYAFVLAFNILPAEWEIRKQFMMVNPTAVQSSCVYHSSCVEPFKKKNLFQRANIIQKYLKRSSRKCFLMFQRSLKIGLTDRILMYLWEDT